MKIQMKNWKTWAMIICVPFITLFIYRTGGYESWLSFLYLIPIIWASMTVSLSAGMGMAIYASSFYLFMIAMDLYGYIPHFPLFATELSTYREKVLLVSTTVLFDKLLIFFIVAAVIFRMAESLREKNKKLAEEKDKIKRIFESVEEAILVVNKMGKVVALNSSAEKIFSLSRNEVIGQSVKGKLGDSALEEKLMEMNKVDAPIIEVVSGKNSNEVYESVLVPLYADEDVVGRIATCRNITKEKQLEKMKSDFIAFCSHQLRGPLSNLKLYFEELLSDKSQSLSQGAYESLKDMQSQVRRLLKMVKYFLNVASIKSGQFKANFKPVQLEKLVETVVDDHQDSAKEHGCSVRFDSSEEKLPEISIDELKTEEVLYNLLQNSIKYLKKDGGEIVLNVGKISDDILNQNLKAGWSEGAPIPSQLLDAMRDLFPHDSLDASKSLGNNPQWYVVSIKDNGIGIPEEDQKSIFTETFRAHNVDPGEGLGIGLFLSKAIMLSLGGRICFQSKEGQGTAFHVLLPVI